jgi:hypothetical protein
VKTAPSKIALKAFAGLLLLIAVVRLSMDFIRSLDASRFPSEGGFAVSFGFHADWITLCLAAIGVLLWILSSRVR